METDTAKKKARPSPKFLAFMEELAKGLDPKAAGKAAGYSPTGGWACKLAKLPEVIKRVEEIALERAWGGSPDLAPVINEMRRIAMSVDTLASAAAMREARELLVEVARLKALLPRAPAAHGKAPGLPDDEWLAKYGPKS